jgi:hypothetical protein
VPEAGDLGRSASHGLTLRTEYQHTSHRNGRYYGAAATGATGVAVGTSTCTSAGS